MARPIQRSRRMWPPVYAISLEALRPARPAGTTRAFVRILRLHVGYGCGALRADHRS